MFNLIEKVKAISAGDISPIEPARGTTFDIKVFIVRGINWFLYFAGALAVIYLIYGGILYITAGGDQEKATAGKTAVINAVIGIIIIALALLIVAWAKSLVSTTA